MIKNPLFVILFFCSLTGVSQDDPATLSRITGSWTGLLQGIHVGFNIMPQGDSVQVTMDSPDQGVNDIPVNRHSFQNNHIVFNVDLVGGIYAGDFSPESGHIEGTWIQHGSEYPLILSRKEGESSGPDRPQEPKPPFPYLIEEVTFTNENDQVQLAGTLTLPEGAGPFPALLLITGSGPQDRNEEILGHKPFWVIADYLTRNGIVVLRYDDRGFGKSTGDYITATTFDFASDAASAFLFLTSDPRVRKDRTGILGHSEGALAALIASSRADSHSNYLILMAAPGLTGRETMNLQTETLMREYGEDPAYIKEVLKLNNKIYTIAVKEENKDDAAGKIRKAYRKFTAGMTQEELQQRGLNDFILKKTIDDMTTPWMRTFIDLDINPYLSQVTCPVLLLYGDRDIQVDPDYNIPPIEKKLTESGRTDYKIVVFPGLNHLFQTSSTGMPSEYGLIKETISPQVLEEMMKWIHLID